MAGPLPFKPVAELSQAPPPLSLPSTASQYTLVLLLTYVTYGCVYFARKVSARRVHRFLRAFRHRLRRPCARSRRFMCHNPAFCRVYALFTGFYRPSFGVRTSGGPVRVALSG